MPKAQPELLTQVTFELLCDATRVYVVILSENGTSLVLPMHPSRFRRWQLTIGLPPAKYMCRYYSGDERNITYLGPARTKGCKIVDMDAVLDIGPRILPSNFAAMSLDGLGPGQESNQYCFQ